MSSPNYHSPFSNTSHSPSFTISPRSLQSQDVPQSNNSERRLPPRLSSPHHFRGFFDADNIAPSSRRTLDRNLPPINRHETMDDDGVNRALQSANRAVQTAQEAFQSRRTPSMSFLDTSGQDVVMLNLTNLVELIDSPPPPPGSSTNIGNEAPDAFLARITHPHDSNIRHAGSNRVLHEPMYTLHPSSTRPHIVIRDDESNMPFDYSDSAVGPRRRYETHRRNEPGIPSMERRLIRSGVSDARRLEDEEAVRRQRLARQQWEEGQRRVGERQRLEAQRQRLLNSPNEQRRNSNNVHASPNSQPTIPSSSSTVEAVDLTNVDDDSALANALSKQRQDAIASQKITSSSAKDGLTTADGNGRTSLSNYKCPICMEPPQYATTTSCGHLFCHKCIHDTLKWSETVRRNELPPGRRVRGVCPVCRKELVRSEKPGGNRGLIPLEIKLISKREMELLRKLKEQEERREEKGKRKADDIDVDAEVHDVDHSDEEEVLNGVSKRGDPSSQRQTDGIRKDSKRPKTVKRDTSADDSLFEFGDLEEFI